MLVMEKTQPYMIVKCKPTKSSLLHHTYSLVFQNSHMGLNHLLEKLINRSEQTRNGAGIKKEIEAHFTLVKVYGQKTANI